MNTKKFLEKIKNNPGFFAKLLQGKDCYIVKPD